MTTDPLLRQISRMYQRPLETTEGARSAIAADAGVLASGLFLEAAASDDVTDISSAMEYLEARLAELADLAGGQAGAIRELFAAKVAAWG